VTNYLQGIHCIKFSSFNGMEAYLTVHKLIPYVLSANFLVTHLLPCVSSSSFLGNFSFLLSGRHSVTLLCLLEGTGDFLGCSTFHCRHRNISSYAMGSMNILWVIHFRFHAIVGHGAPISVKCRLTPETCVDYIGSTCESSGLCKIS